MNGTLESKSKRSTMIRQSSSHGNLADEQTMDFIYNTTDRGQVKRTKSFWKFGKGDSEEIVMSMWKHRDLIQPEEEMRMEEERLRETTLKRNQNKAKAKKDEQKQNKQPQSNGRVKEMQQNLTVPMIDDHTKYQLTKSEIDQRIGKTKERFYQEDVAKSPIERNGKTMVRDSETELGYAEDEDELVTVDESHTMAKNSRMKSYEVNHNLNNKLANKYYHEDMDDERFYDDESMNQEVMVMKTVKRKEILKQYYSSGTSDTERHSSSSDPYDCIVVQDHHLMRKKNNLFNNSNNKNKEMTTFRSEFAMNKKNTDTEQTILPRTKLVKNSAVDTSITAATGTGKKSREGAGVANGGGDKKKPQNVDPKIVANDKRKNFDESKRNSLSSAKSYGPWYDLWGANANNNPNNNNTLISQK